MKRLAAMLLLGAICLGLGGCGGAGEIPALREPVTITYDTAVVLRGDIARMEQHEAFVCAEMDELAFANSGTVSDILVEVGDTVKAGQLLAQESTQGIDDALKSMDENLADLANGYAENRNQTQYDMEEQTIYRRMASGGKTDAELDAAIAAQESAVTAVTAALETLRSEATALQTQLDALQAQEEPTQQTLDDIDLTKAALAANAALQKTKGDELTQQQEALDKQKEDRQTVREIDIELQKLENSLSYLYENYALQQSHFAQSLEELKTQREECFLYAAHDGTVVQVAVRETGSWVSAKSAVLVVAVAGTAYIRYDGERDLARTKARAEVNVNGTRYEVKLIPYTEADYKAITLSGQTPRARFAFAGAAASVQPGDYAQLILYLVERQDVLYIPVNALYEGADYQSGYVYRVVDGEKQYTDVTYGQTTNSWVEIKSGLAEGDVVYVKQ